eukprot:TRINITY_DN8892_c0_g1_i1.p1 TRINITY_DN8892_c0_g1~~TRINITY_DN8892_c0_g1_i1.p1  ORF type:complete len:565 (-),score=77.95 TRINITY_DN8892_c0_g1_i1:103-1797(-)
MIVQLSATASDLDSPLSDLQFRPRVKRPRLCGESLRKVQVEQCDLVQECSGNVQVEECELVQECFGADEVELARNALPPRTTRTRTKREHRRFRTRRHTVAPAPQREQPPSPPLLQPLLLSCKETAPAGQRWAVSMCQKLQCELQEASTAGLGSRPLRLGTDCAGADAPWFALGAISRELSQQLGVNLQIDHLFACDIERVSRKFIVQNSQPQAIFGDLLCRRRVGHCVRAERLRPVPYGLDIYVAGFPCKDFSLMNSERPCLQGPNAGVFHDVVRYIREHQPTTFVLENVLGLAMKQQGEKPPIDQVMKILRSIPNYKVRGWRVNSMDYYLPQNRTRIYIVGVHVGRARLRRPLFEWSVMKNTLSESLAVSAHAFMLDDDSPEVRGVYEHLGTHPQKESRCMAWKITNQQLRKKLGLVKTDTDSTASSKANDWSRFISSRQRDNLDLQAARIGKRRANLDLASSEWISEISRSVMYCSNMCGVTPCLTPGSIIWVHSRQRFLIGQEKLALQGFPVAELNLEGLSDADLSMLAGNAMSVPVVGLFLYLIFANVEFPSEGVIELD